MARQGFDTEKLTQNLSSIDLKTTFEPLESISETDLESYLKHEHELIVLSAIEEAKKEVMTIILIQALFNFFIIFKIIFSIGSRSALHALSKSLTLVFFVYLDYRTIQFEFYIAYGRRMGREKARNYRNVNSDRPCLGRLAKNKREA